MISENSTDRTGTKQFDTPPYRCRDLWAIEPMPGGLDGSPLDFLFADHHRQRQAVQILLKIADGEYDPIGVRNLIVFLEVDFALHIMDEEHDFLPLLRMRCFPEDDIDTLIERLAQEHADDESSVVEVIAILQQLLQGHQPSDRDRARIRAFAAHLRRHLALENGVLLPIARVRMDARSLDILAAKLKERRARRR